MSRSGQWLPLAVAKSLEVLWIRAVSLAFIMR